MTAREVHRDAVLVRRLDARVRNLGGVVVVAGPEQAFELSESALYVWSELDGERSVGELAARMAEAFEVEIGTALEDIVELLSELLAERVVSVRQTG